MKKIKVNNKNTPVNRKSVLVSFSEKSEPYMEIKFIDGNFRSTETGKIVYPTHYKNK